jgi:hypothetical protein
MVNRRYFAMGDEPVFFGGPDLGYNWWYRTLEDSIRDDQQHIYPDDTERADAVTSIPGPYKVAGDIGGYAEPYYFGFVWKKALGVWSASTIIAVGVYTHSVITTESDVEHFCMQKGLQLLNSAIEYQGCKFENMRLESRMGQPLMWTGTVRGMKSSMIAQVTTVNIEAGYDAVLNPWMHHELILYHGSDYLKIQTFRLNIRNKLADAYYTSRFSEEWEFEGREITGTLSLKCDDVDMIEKFFGADNYKRPAATTTPYAIAATYTTAYTISGTHYGVFKVHLPRVDLNTMAIGQRGRETETVELPFKALYDRTVNYTITSTIKTTHAKPL